MQAGEPHLSVWEGTISKHRKNTRLIGGSQQNFEEKLMHNQPEASYNKLTGLVDKGVGTLDALYLAFNKAFDTVSHVILMEYLKKSIWQVGMRLVETQFKGWALLL